MFDNKAEILEKEKYVQILDCLADNGGQATTSTVRDYCGFEQTNSVKYRARNMEEVGVVEVIEKGSKGSQTPHEVKLTEEGKELLEDVDVEVEETVTQEELDALQDELEAQRKIQNMLNRRLHRIEDELAIDTDVY